MSQGSQTQVVNGQRNIFPTGAQWNPIGYGPSTVGVPQVSPTMPPFLGGGGSGTGLGIEGVGGYGTAGGNLTATAIAGANPWNPKVSSVWWAVILLVVGLMLLKAVHWRETILESGHAGPVHEEAHEEAAA